MHDFQYRKSDLYAEGVPVRKIAEEVGTPLYIYSHRTFLRHLNAYRNSFNGHPHTICFAVKANSNTAILKLLGANGAGADVVSGGELFLSLRSGIPASRIVYAGVGKTEPEIVSALKAGILMFNVESSEELKAINLIAGGMNKTAPIALRVNPDIDPRTHPYISTGLKKSKFGIPIEEALEHYRLARGLNNIRILGIHKHIGSQITMVRPYVDSLKKLLNLAQSLKSGGIQISHLNIGGGLGIDYGNDSPPDPTALSRAILPLLSKYRFHLILEPGRSIAGNAGILVTKALYRKQRPEKEFIIVDAGMNDLLRPSLYNAFHRIVPVKKNRRMKILADIVGPICESGDFIAKDRSINRVLQGDLLAVMSAGAYGFTMSSTYNSRPRAAEVLVRGKSYSVIRKRENYGDLLRGVKVPAYLK
jgi:diaminopimelate decarboxylase